MGVKVCLRPLLEVSSEIGDFRLGREAEGESGRVNGSLVENVDIDVGDSSAVACCAGESKSLPSLPNTFICTVSSGALCGRAVEDAFGGVDVMVMVLLVLLYSVLTVYCV